MRTETGKAVRLRDYAPPDYLIDTVDLVVALAPHDTRVRSRLTLRPNPKGRAGAPLVLDGDELRATRVALDGRTLSLDATDLSPSHLTIANPPARSFTLEVDTVIDPVRNTQLMGLYRSGHAYCTQCEAEGFRRITYFLDRPDVLSVYTTRIEADRGEAPVLLGNGNPVEAGDLGDGRHYAVWRDPFPKPCYLFALVGGDLGVVADTFTTMSGRGVALGVHVEKGREAHAHYAMDALKRSMRWDEEKFGREYDLDVFNIVAVSDFNMGAMENKGLNIFNDKYVLALPDTATDTDYDGIETVIAHEYFHNWTGNRITCRDWFQLCLKEGLTVFRDQEFSADQRSRPVRRITDVRALRLAQFAEDAGPLAHNVRPEVYHEINNFYTATVYQKGAEVIRMLRTLIGEAAFRRGMDIYFERCDGTAATVEQFIACFAESSGRDLGAFMRWYTQAGTPIVHAHGVYDATARRYSLTLRQQTTSTPGQDIKKPQVIPVALGLLDDQGRELPLRAPSSGEAGGAEARECSSGVFELAGAERVIHFVNVDAPPTPSLFRRFSAPVRLESDITERQLLVLMAHDSDLFNRWQAGQTYATRLLIRAVDDVRAGRLIEDANAFCDALGRTLEGWRADGMFTALALTPPTEADLARDIGSDVDPDAIHAARRHLQGAIGARLAAPLRAIHDELSARPDTGLDATSAARRAMRNMALALLAAADSAEGAARAAAQFASAPDMTARMGALATLSLIPGEAREAALARFRAAYANDVLALDKWFAVQATIPGGETLARVRALMADPLFSMTNPNRLRAVVASFASANPTAFNAADGSGYAFVRDVVLELDALNPQVAARMLGAFRSWRTLEAGRRSLAQASLRDIANKSNLSADVRDIVTRALA